MRSNQPLEDDLADVAAGRIQKNDDRRVHHRLDLIAGAP
jgi:hypothetical protein